MQEIQHVVAEVGPNYYNVFAYTVILTWSERKSCLIKTREFHASEVYLSARKSLRPKHRNSNDTQKFLGHAYS